jgi:hypothetical protein
MVLPDDPEVTLLEVYSEKVENLSPHKNLHMNIYSSFIRVCTNLEAAGKWINKLWCFQTMNYLVLELIYQDME